MIIEGNFTKIIYSDSVVSLNGIYLYCPLEPLVPAHMVSHRETVVPEDDQVDTIILTKKTPFTFSLMNPHNIYLIKELNRIEHEIIEYYKEYFQINKINVYSLRNQLKSGNIKVIHKVPTLRQDDTVPPEQRVSNHQEIMERAESNINSLIIKISGIWETETNVGITFKFQC
jgi:hypothetical protein